MIRIEPFRVSPTVKEHPDQVKRVLSMIESLLNSQTINYEYVFRYHRFINIENVMEVVDNVVKLDFQHDLEIVLAEYKDFQRKITLLSNLLSFPIKERMMHWYRSQFKRFNIEILLNEISRARNSQEYDTITGVVQIYIDLGLYYSEFEVAFVEASRKYYEPQFLIISEMAPLEFIHSLNEWVSSQCVFIQHGTQQLLTNQTYQIIGKNIDVVVSKCFETLLSDQESFEILVRLCTKTNTKAALKERIFKLFVEHSYTPAGIISELIDLKSKYSFLLNDTDFDGQIKLAISTLVNKNHVESSKLIAIHLDRLLKKKTVEDMEKHLKDCIEIFRQVEGKDIFEAFYGKMLSKRLLLDKSASVDAEKSMLLKLRSECGPGFTKKLEGMFRDMEISQDIMNGFDNSKFRNRLGSIEFSANVLTSGFWPSYPIVELNLPAEMSEYQNIFTEYFMTKHNGRRLTWPHSLGHCLLKYNHPLVIFFNQGQKDLVISLYQTVVLMLFNDNNELTAKEIQEKTLLEQVDLARTLQSLSLTKTKLLRKEPFVKEVLPSDKFSINDKFTHPLRRIVINQIQAQETKEEIEKTTEKCFEDRQYMVDATIVRIMKAEKRISYKGLLTKIFGALKFPVDASDLKKRIESLVDRDYMERDSVDTNMYVYLA